MHLDVFEVLEEVILEQQLDITLNPFVRFLITYGFQVRKLYLLDSIEIIQWLDDSYLQTGQDNGRVSQRIYSLNPLIQSMSGEEAYQCLISGMLALDLGLDKLEVGLYSYED